MTKQKGGGPPADQPWCWYTRAMLLSDAFRDMSINCRRFIAALEVENMSHAGSENGCLVMPYNQLERYWHIPRRLIRPTIEEAKERGLVVEERRGWRLSYAKSMPNLFRLSFRPTREGNPPRWIEPTNDWRRYRSPKNASKGSEVKPDKCHIVQRAKLPSVPLRELASVSDRELLSISRVVAERDDQGTK